MLVTHDHDPSSLQAELETRLVQFNESHAGPRRAEHVALSIRDLRGRILAGLIGETFWNALFIDMLWVDEPHRGQQCGRSLLEHAENLACDRGCDVAYLSTFEFQAPAFYTAMGYAVFGELRGVPTGSQRLWFWKALSSRADTRRTKESN